MKKQTIYSVSFMVMILSVFCSNADASVPVSLRPRIYLGLGIRSAYENRMPIIHIEDDMDQNYYNLNWSSNKKIFFHGQVRLNLIKVWQFSAGYTFISHNQNYLHDYPELWAKENKLYPYSYNYNLHGAVIQWDLDFPPLSNKYFKPFILGGGGRYTGNRKSFYFEFQFFDEEKIIYVTDAITETERFMGEAVFFGVGATVMRYGYFQLGYIDFRDGTLPIREFLTFMIGFTV